jgi:hypothetical protein
MKLARLGHRFSTSKDTRPATGTLARAPRPAAYAGSLGCIGGYKMRAYRFTLKLFAATAALTSCGSSEPSVVPTYAKLYASAIGFNPETGGSEGYWACTLEGTYPFPDWPTDVRTDSIDAYFTRGYLYPDGHAIVRGTQLLKIPLTLTHVTPRQVQLAWGPPFNQTQLGTFKAEGQGTLNADWLCSADLPFAADSELVAAGYKADSLLPGYVRVTRVSFP